MKEKESNSEKRIPRRKEKRIGKEREKKKSKNLEPICTYPTYKHIIQVIQKFMLNKKCM